MVKDTTLIIGYGVTGKALAAFFAGQGRPYAVAEDAFNVDIRDGFFRGQARLDGETLSLGGKPADPTIFKEVYPSPGVSPAHPIAAWSVRHGVPVVSELDLAAGLLKTGELIGITGTNGKSTTVKLIAALLAGAGLKTGVYGNYGSPLIVATCETPKDYYVVEESSYQLELTRRLRHRVAACLNVSEDHLDRYRDVREYASAKARIVAYAGADDVFVYNADDVHCARMAMDCFATALPISLVKPLAEGAFLEGSELVVRRLCREFRYPLARCALKGLHNVENMLAGLLCATVALGDGACSAAFDRVLSSFEGLPHRVQKVYEENGVSYYDDSKGTNVGAAAMALAGFEGGVILIAGGRDKRGDYAPLKGLVKAKVKRLILIGEASTRMKEALGDQTETLLADGMREAVRLAKECAKPGDTVLLSPACSSFDRYADYKERGRDFQKWARGA